MRILVYKRTHSGDPDYRGCFGVHDCMGSVRGYEYDAVIGIGGIGPEARSNDISGKVNWIGRVPHKRQVDGKRGPEVRFAQFVNYGIDGPNFSALAPKLAKRMYSKNVRYLILDPSCKEYPEAERIVLTTKYTSKAPKSGNAKTRCTSRSCRSSQQRTRC